MTTKSIEFDEVYDKFAIRIVIETRDRLKGEPQKSFKEYERGLCWKVFTTIINRYQQHPNRLRDWITNPKSNGYESLHVTVMANNGTWVEVQIRTKQMDEVAEKGLAAHWKYKEKAKAYDKKGCI